MKRNEYTSAFIKRALNRCSNEPAAAVARDLGVHPRTLLHWRTRDTTIRGFCTDRRIRAFFGQHGPATAREATEGLAYSDVSAMCSLLRHYQRRGILVRTKPSGRYVYALADTNALPPTG